MRGVQAERYSKLRGIITGVTPISLYLEFLSSHNHADRQARLPLPALCNFLLPGVGPAVRRFAA